MFSFDHVQAIIFDLDDTLVHTSLDFATLKQSIGCHQGMDILSFIEQIDCEIEKRKAHDIVLQHELSDARTSTWIEGAKAFVEQAKSVNLPLAIVTRNCRQATQLKIQKNQIDIDLVLTREDAPPKPDPSALLTIANKWKISPANIAYIGDYIYDIEAAHNANMQAWLYTHENTYEYAKKLSFISP